MKKKILWIGILFLIALGAVLQFTPPEFIYKHFVAPRAQAADITDLTATTGLIGKEDISWGSTGAETFTVSTYSGGTVTLTKLPALLANAYSMIKGQWYVAVSDTITDHGAGSGADYTAGNLKKIIDTIGATDVRAIKMPPGTYTIGTNLTPGSNIYFEVPPGAVFSVSATKTLTLDSPAHLLYASPAQQIFSGSGSVRYTKRGKIHPAHYGAVGDGSTADTTVFTAIVAMINANTETDETWILEGLPGAHYVINADQTVTVSNVTMDWQWATISSTGNYRFLFNGDSGVDGDWSSALSNIFFRNCFIGTANDANNNFMAPHFWWCLDSGMENIVKKGHTGTAFRISISKRCYIKNSWCYGAQTTSSAFAALVWLSDDCLVDNFHIRDGSFTYCLQVKGGYNNRVTNVSVDGNADAGTVTVDHMIRDRGDAPWGDSATDDAPYTVTYPWNTGEWDLADERRASHNTVFENCSVRNSGGAGLANAFHAQEAIGTKFVNCYADENVRAGIIFSRASTDAVGERDFSAIDCNIDGTVLSVGIAATGNSSYSLRGVKIIGGRYEKAYLSGCRLTYTEDALIDGATFRNNGQGAQVGDTYGIRSYSANIRPKIVNCSFIDDQTPATMTVGVFLLGTDTMPILKDCHAEGMTTYNFVNFPVGSFGGLTPSQNFGQTTDGTVLTALSRITFKTGEMARVIFTAIGLETGGDYAIYQIGGSFYYDGGAAVLQIGSTDTIAEDETDATWGGASFAIVGDTLYCRVAGLAATTINWKTHLEVLPY